MVARAVTIWGITIVHAQGITVAVIPDWAWLVEIPSDMLVGWLGYRAAKWWRARHTLERLREHVGAPEED